MELLHKAIKYSTSTKSRYFIKDSSEKYCLKFSVFWLYLPSIGDIAVKEVKSILHVLNEAANLLNNCVIDWIFLNHK